MTCDREGGRRLWCCRVHASFRVTYGCGLRGSQQGERLWGSRGCRAPAALVLSRSSTWLSLARHSGSHGIILPPLFLTKRFKTLDWALICKLGAPPLPIILLVACSLGSGRGFPGVCRWSPGPKGGCASDKAESSQERASLPFPGWSSSSAHCWGRGKCYSFLSKTQLQQWNELKR